MVYFTQNRLLCSATTPTLYSALGDIIIRRIKTMATKQEIIMKKKEMLFYMKMIYY